MLVAKNQLNKEAHSSSNAKYILTPKNYKLDISLFVQLQFFLGHY